METALRAGGRELFSLFLFCVLSLLPNPASVRRPRLVTPNLVPHKVLVSRRDNKEYSSYNNDVSGGQWRSIVIAENQWDSITQRASLSSNLVSVQTPSRHHPLTQVLAAVDPLPRQVRSVPSPKRYTSPGHHRPGKWDVIDTVINGDGLGMEAHLDMTLSCAGERVDHDRKNIW